MKNTPPSVNRLLELSAQPLKARDMSTFLQGVRETAMQLHHTILGDDSAAGQAALSAALDHARRSPKHRRVLELSAWPIFDKPGLPLTTESPQEFLWLFALPTLVKLPEAWGDMLLLPGDFLNTGLIVDCLENAGCLHSPAAITSGFASLYSREDLHALGPQGLAQHFIEAETIEGAGLPLPLPLVLDPDIESARTVLLHVLLAVRLPVGEVQLFNREGSWPLEEISQIILEDLRAAGVPAETVTCSRGCSLAETAFRCAGPGLKELETWLSLGIEHYGLTRAYLALPVDGVAELVGVTDIGDELLLAPSFNYLEPQQELEATLSRLCKEQGLEFTGTFLTAIQTTAMLH